MTIINMVGWWASWPQVPLDAISVIAVEWWNAEATITWTDPSDIVVNWVTVTTWSSTKLVRKVGSAPTDSSDWTLVVTETVRDTYSSTWYTDTWLINGTTYYYAAFAVWNNWLETISSITPDVTPAQRRTFTITWTEASNPAFSVTYSDDAAWLTAWSTAFDDFFGYSGVRLSTAWVETATVAQSWWVLDITQLWTLTSGDNVMIKFPVRWIKMSKSWSDITLSITDGIGRESEWYQYYAFQNTWDIVANASTTVATKPFYMWAYLAYNDSNTLKSWSGKTPSASFTHWNAITYAQNNWTWYTISGFYQTMYIIALYMMKYWNGNGQSTIGMWYVSLSNTWPATTWWTNSQTNATYWTSSQTTQMKLFGIEDWRWNMVRWTWWVFTDSSRNVWTALHNYTANISTSESQYKNTWVQVINWEYNLKWISWTNNWLFACTVWDSNSDYNTYYCANVYATTNRLSRAWAGWNYNKLPSAFSATYFASTSSSSWNNQWARIMYIN